MTSASCEMNQRCENYLKKAVCIMKRSNKNQLVLNIAIDQIGEVKKL